MTGELNSSKHKDKIFLNNKQAAYLKPTSSPRPRQFYLLPKIHKELGKWTIPNRMPPGRPIVSDCSSESYRISEYIDYFLQPLAKMHPSYLKDTWDFLQKLEKIQVPHNALLITLDVESLYTNIQIEEGLKSVRNIFRKNPKILRPDKHILKLLELSLRNNDFQFNGQWYLQISGTAMGKKFAPSYANIYMAELEQELLGKAGKLPLAYWRFLDDIFIIWPYSEIEFLEFLKLLNNHNDSIKLTHTINKDSIDFLDVTIFKGERFQTEHILDTKVYFKPTDTHELLHKESFHPPHTFKGILKSQIIRFYKICNNSSDSEEACSILFRTLRQKRNYSARFLRIIKSSTLKKLECMTETESPMGASLKCGKPGCECCLYVKQTSDIIGPDFDYPIIGKLTCNSTNLIYIIECTKCNEYYVGETSKTLRQRLTAHLSDIRNELNKPVAEHFNDLYHSVHLDMVIYPIQQVLEQGSPEINTVKRRKIEQKWIETLETMEPYGLNIKLVPANTIAFTTTYNATAVKLSGLVREKYKELQNKFPRHLRDELVFGYKRNKNLADILISSKLKESK